MRGVSVVADASALLAYFHGEGGKERVSEALGKGIAVSAVNWAEVLSKLSARGLPPKEAGRVLRERGIIGEGLLIVPFDSELAEGAASLFLLTRSHGLSLGDRACLALGMQLGLSVLTTDRAWKALSLPVKIDLIR